MAAPAAPSERLDELLLRRAIEGLDGAAEQELERLLAAERNVDHGAYERAAAAVCLAVLGGRGKLPLALRARLEQQALEVAMPPGEGP
jgi:hypothetical protein